MSPEMQSVHNDAAALQKLGALLGEAIGIADELGLDFTAIRIAEAMTAICNQTDNPVWEGVPLLN